jgi:hypothetical protein
MSKTNPYVNFYDHGGEQGLQEELIIESIKFYGITFYYIPREDGDVSPVFGEDVLSTYTRVFQIEMYVKSVDGFQGDGHFMNKFGLEIRDSATITVSKSRFLEETEYEFTRPREGDLLFFPLNNILLEIKFVTDKTPFFQLGKNFVYDMTVEMFEYAQQKIDTGYDEVDDIEKEIAFTQEIVLGAGSGNYVVDETVTQTIAGPVIVATAKVTSWDSGTKVLRVRNIKGKFQATTLVIGGTSAASYALTSTDEFDDVLDPISDNKDIEDVGDGIIDFTEDDPFSEDI